MLIRDLEHLFTSKGLELFNFINPFVSMIKRCLFHFKIVIDLQPTYSRQSCPIAFISGPFLPSNSI